MSRVIITQAGNHLLFSLNTENGNATATLTVDDSIDIARKLLKATKNIISRDGCGLPSRSHKPADPGSTPGPATKQVSV